MCVLFYKGGWMEKMKLGVCIEDEEYQTRFVRCILKHYKASYEVHILEDKCSEEVFDVIIMDEDSQDARITKETSIVFVLEENSHYEHKEESEPFFYVEKYQEVYKIMEELEKKAAKALIKKKSGIRDAQVVGICSLDKAGSQMPFTALLAETLGEKQRVLVIDLQPYSGFDTDISSDENSLGIEDMISLSTTGNYTRSRLMASIGHEQKWDYVYPARNMMCLLELDGSIYQNLIEILQKEMEYDWIIVNFGTLFLGNYMLLESCQACYFLSDRKEERSWRERSFVEALHGKKQENFLEKIIWIQVPKEQIRELSWRAWMKNWLWSELGDEVRERNWVARIDE